MRSLRLLTLTMLVAFLLLGLKVGEIVRGGQIIALSLGEEAHAQATPAPAPAANSPLPATDTKPDTKTDTKADTKADAKTDTKDAAAKPADTDKAKGPSDESDEEEPANKKEFSQVEVDILQSLAKRREKLDDWAKQIQLKENMLIATEGRLNDKIETLQKMKKELENLLALYNEQEDIKIRSLVKIYENMKPKDAARIFEELDMPVLLTVVDRMNERKVSPILAAMSPTKAKDLTIQLAEQRKLQKERPGATASSAPAPTTPPAAAAGR